MKNIITFLVSLILFKNQDIISKEELILRELNKPTIEIRRSIDEFNIEESEILI